MDNFNIARCRLTVYTKSSSCQRKELRKPRPGIEPVRHCACVPNSLSSKDLRNAVWVSQSKVIKRSETTFRGCLSIHPTHYQKTDCLTLPTAVRQYTLIIPQSQYLVKAKLRKYPKYTLRASNASQTLLRHLIKRYMCLRKVFAYKSILWHTIRHSKNLCGLVCLS